MNTTYLPGQGVATRPWKIRNVPVSAEQVRSRSEMDAVALSWLMAEFADVWIIPHAVALPDSLGILNYIDRLHWWQR